MKKAKKLLCMLIALVMAVSLLPAEVFAAEAKEYPMTFTVGGESVQYSWNYVESEDYGGYYELTGVVYCSNPVAEDYQSLNIYVPDAYMGLTGPPMRPVFGLNGENVINGYTVNSAPVLVCNAASGWAGSTPKTLDGFGRSLELDFAGLLEQGCVIVSIGTRGPATKNEDGTYNGKAPENVADAKAAVRFLKANANILPGDMDKLISVGTSGGGGMSAILGASGNAEEYLPYLYEMGACGVSKSGDTYVDTGDDSVFAMQAYAAISDLDNADLGYNWFYGPKDNYTDFEKAIQSDMAAAYENYVAEVLGCDDIDDYAEDLAAWFEDSLNSYLEGLADDSARQSYLNAESKGAVRNTWISYENGAASIKGSTAKEKIAALAASHNTRSKAVLGFDNLTPGTDGRAENQLFGLTGTTTNRLHFSESVARILLENKDRYSALTGGEARYSQGFGGQSFDGGGYTAFQTVYTENGGIPGYDNFIDAYNTALTPEMQERAYMMNPMNYITEYKNGTSDVQPAEHFRLIYGSTDANTSPTVTFNIGKLLEQAGIDAVYELYWDGGHGNFTPQPGETEPFSAWIDEICAPEYELDLKTALRDGLYEWEYVAADGDDPAYYRLLNVSYCSEPVLPGIQAMNIYVPAQYMNADGSMTKTKLHGYTAATAPIVYKNNNGAYNGSVPKEVNLDFIKAGFVMVNVGSRGRNSAEPYNKSPASIVDLKAGVRFLRANAAVIPGNEERLISWGSSGGGQFSAVLGASGNMDIYDPYLEEIGAIMDQRDDVYAAMCYCPIADIDNADMAYAWWWYDTSTSGYTDRDGKNEFSEFQYALQDDLSSAFVEYVNGLNLGTKLTGGREGTYYDAILGEMSKALNAYMADQNKDEAWLIEQYGAGGALPDWLEKNRDGSFAVTDMSGFIKGTELNRNKDIPGFDTLDRSAENDAFGKAGEEQAVHYSASIANVMRDNQTKYSALDGYSAETVNAYISEALREDIVNQTYMYNAMRLIESGESTVAKYWRTRNGTQDQHTSFTVAYNLAQLLSKTKGVKDVDYALVWNMGHGENEGTSTGTFIDWVYDIAPASSGSSSSGSDGSSTTPAVPTTPTKPVTPTTPAKPAAPVFTDVAANAYYADAVAWAVGKGITQGLTATSFGPDASCTRAQMVTFLWRMAGSPKASGTSSFSDVSADSYYYDAVMWAVSRGITSGTSSGVFSPDAAVTRSQSVTFLYRYAGQPAAAGGAAFTDVAANAYYADAVAWASANSVTTGTSETTFSPDSNCTRGQIVTFMFRYAG